MTEQESIPRRFRIPIPPTHPHAKRSQYQYGCYFPMTELVVGDMGGRGTGKPKDVEWIDEEPWKEEVAEDQKDT